MDVYIGTPGPYTGLSQVKALLSRRGLDYEPEGAITVRLMDGEVLAATGSLCGNVCKFIAVDPAYEGQGLTAAVVTALRTEARRLGRDHLFLYTKPVNALQFTSLGFYPVAQTQRCLLLESVKDGARRFTAALPTVPGHSGVIVANCNPFTLGHQYLIETAAAACTHLYVLVVTEDKGMFSPGERLSLVKAGTAHLPNVTVCTTGGYLVSSATFPDYFLPDKEEVPEIQCRLDLEVFLQYFVPALQIDRRFVGTEPISRVTAAYNRAMLALLPARGVAVTELPRLELCGAPVSASRVRKLLAEGDLGGVRQLVPESTYTYLSEHYHRK